MTLRKLSKIIIGLLLACAVAIGLTSVNHPIILKWVTGSARHFGTPIQAAIYTDGQVNDDLKVFYTDEGNNYLLSWLGHDSSGTAKFLNIDLNEQRISQAVGKSKVDHDFIAGHLFQSKTGVHFSPFGQDANGFPFDPQLSFTGRQIKFQMPPDRSAFDSIRIDLP